MSESVVQELCFEALAPLLTSLASSNKRTVALGIFSQDLFLNLHVAFLGIFSCKRDEEKNLRRCSTTKKM